MKFLKTYEMLQDDDDELYTIPPFNPNQLEDDAEFFIKRFIKGGMKGPNYKMIKCLDYYLILSIKKFLRSADGVRNFDDTGRDYIVKDKIGIIIIGDYDIVS